MVAVAILNFKNFNFWSVTVIMWNIWCGVQNFIKIVRLFTEIWWFNDFQNGGRPPSWILHICIFCPVALVSMPFCFIIQNFAEIWQLVDELWPKKRFSIVTNFCTCVGVHDVITSANFYDCRLWGLSVVGGQILGFSIDSLRRPYNTLALPCECVISRSCVIRPINGKNLKV